MCNFGPFPPALHQEYFPECGRGLISCLFGVWDIDQDVLIPEQHFVDVIDKVLAPRSTSSLARFYFEAFCGTGVLQEQKVELLVRTAFSLFLVASGLSQNVANEDVTKKDVTRVTQTILSKGSSGAGLDWMETSCPELLMGMHQWLTAQLAPSDDVDAATVPDYTLPDHEGAVLSVAMWWMLSSSLPSLYTQPTSSTEANSSGEATQRQAFNKRPWTLLYSSKDHGLSVNRLQHHVLGYRGPTVLIVRCEGDYVYAVALDTEWREGTTPWGGTSSVLLRLSPDYGIIEEGDKMVLFNDKSRNLPKGLFVGRDPKRRSLSLTEGLQTVTHRGLTGSVVDAEVWGCASSDAKLAQAKQKKAELKDAERNAKVKLPGQWDDNPDRLLIGWGTARTDYADGFREDRK
ncbi:uncharacterized protein [Diadema setosum]|uniref:uncharacterized protein n=1 Tax=Diadema setosum TaxID=31175 RepID=UPI003B3BB346